MDIKKVTVAGGGVLGSQIAFQSAYCGYDVTIWLRSEASIGRCQPKLDRLCEIYLQTLEAMKKDPEAYAYGLCTKDEVEAGHLDELKQQVRHAYSSINLTTSYEEAFGDADFVVEAIAENAEQKTAFYTTVVPYLPQKVIVVTNSSTLLPGQFADLLPQPKQYLALHFANEIWKNPTAEVMRQAKTSDKAFEATVAFAKSIRMVPLKVMKEQPGYLLNSMLVPLLNAALSLWAGGVGSVEDIDAAWTMSTGAPAGPFRMLDIIGLTTAYNIMVMNPKAKDPASLEALIVKKLKAKIDAGETGVSAGKGFYTYSE